ncbi:MAG TPA: MFS transporter [Stellaceae bacterium]|jgi:MFS family permease|nr:MFS transporter [Stellaceae bacterium]
MLKTGIFANRWWLVVGSLLGLLVNTGVIEVFTFSVFLKPISEELGYQRETIALAGVFGSLCATFATPAFGKAIDHFGLRKVHLPMICLYALATGLLFFLNSSFGLMVAFFCFRGIVGSGQSPIAYSKAIAAWFDKDRGLALGIAIAGVGLGVAIMPQIANWLIAEYGWREAFVGLGAAILVIGFIPALLFVREPPYHSDHVIAGRPAIPGATFGEAVFHDWRFWAMTIAFFIGVVAINGMITRVVPLLSDRGIARAVAVSALSASGIALTVGRIVSGWSLDRVHGPYVACTFFGSAMIGILLLSSGAGGTVPFIATVLCGLGIGAEVDLMAFFVSRYFGLRSFGAIYGTLFALFSVGNSVGPYLMDLSFGHAGSYVPMMLAFVVALGVACGLLLPLGAYRYAVSVNEIAGAVGEEP